VAFLKDQKDDLILEVAVAKNAWEAKSI